MAWSLAGVDLLCGVAPLALDVAAPDHLAVTRLLHHPSLHIVAPPTAQDPTVSLLVTHPPLRAQRVLASPAVVGRALPVHKVTFARLSTRRVLTTPDQLTFTGGLIGGCFDLDCRVVFVF